MGRNISEHQSLSRSAVCILIYLLGVKMSPLTQKVCWLIVLRAWVHYFGNKSFDNFLEKNMITIYDLINDMWTVILFIDNETVLQQYSC